MTHPILVPPLQTTHGRRHALWLCNLVLRRPSHPAVMGLFCALCCAARHTPPRSRALSARHTTIHSEAVTHGRRNSRFKTMEADLCLRGFRPRLPRTAPSELDQYEFHVEDSSAISNINT